MYSFNKVEVRKWALFYKKCLASYISTELFLKTHNLKKLVLKKSFSEEGTFSEYTINLLNELIHLNDMVSKFKPLKPNSKIRTSLVKIDDYKYLLNQF